MRNHFNAVIAVALFVTLSAPAFAAGAGTPPASASGGAAAAMRNTTAVAPVNGAVGNPTGTGPASNMGSAPIPNTSSAPIPNTGSAPIPNTASAPIPNTGSAPTSNLNGNDANAAGVAVTPAPANGAVNTANSALTPHERRMAEWKTEDGFWRGHFASRPYASRANYTTYQPAYQYGVTLFNQNNGRPYSELNQQQIQAEWQQAAASTHSTLSWDQAQAAIRDSYDRLYKNEIAQNLSNTTGTTPAIMQ